ncbi:MAG: hypothetical protein R3B06_25810 [Kofleriaceae bacterium]
MTSPRLLRQPAVIAAAIVVFAALVLLPGIGTPGLWEPQEMAVADQAAAIADGTYHPTPPTTACKVTPSADGARTLTPRAAAWGLAHVSSSDAGLRIPLALFGLALVAVVFALGWRLGSTRAGAVGALTLISFPLWSLQARQLSGELPGALGGALLVYALVAIAAPRHRAALPFAVDLGVALVALVVGARLAFQGSGALVGLLPPLAAVAIAGSFALPELGTLVGRGWARLDRTRLRAAGPPIDPWRTAAVATAALLTVGVSIWIARQVFDLGVMTPGTREVGGKSILVSDCWSSAVGGLWRKDDNLASLYDGLFEQAGFGMYPAALLVVVAMGALVSGLGDPRRRFAGALVFAWAAGAWVAAAVFARKVGPVMFTGFPACAVAVGLFVDELYRRRAEAEVDPAPYRQAAWSLLGLIVVLGVVVLGKDLEAFPERLTSLPFGSADAIKYPTQARLLGLPTKAWALLLGLVVALPFAVDVWLWRPQHARRGVRGAARYGLPAALAGLAVVGLFWTHGWHRGLSQNLSSKHIFSVYRDLKQPSETLGILGNMGNAPRYYAGGPWDTLANRDALLTYLRRPTRVFAMAPAAELCAIHRAKADGLSYFVLDDSNTQTLLLSNQLGRGTDQNPIATSILRERPTDVGTPVTAVYDDAIELIGVKMPQAVARGGSFEMTLFYRVKKAVPGKYQVFVHFDGGQRFNGDHWPVRDRCATSFWQAGDYIVDRFKVNAGNVSFNKGPYTVYTGLFTGSNPNWRNMTVTSGDKDANNRVKIGTLLLK